VLQRVNHSLDAAAPIPLPCETLILIGCRADATEQQSAVSRTRTWS
jgi:hypothetical protein